VNYISNYSQGQVSKKADIETRVLSDRLNQEISKVNQFVSTMSGSPWIWPALAYNNIEDIDKANEVLDRYNGNLKMSVSYLIDKNGMTVASSNRDAKDSFIGELYYIRPYFQDALSGKPGSYMGVGLTSKQRGYYSSMPVKNPQGEILGVVAIKKNAKILEEYFKVYSHAFLVNKSGVIFLSSDASLVFNTLWPVDKNVLDELIGSKQFSEIFPCKPVFSKELLNDTIVSYNKNNFYALRRSISLPGWDIIFLSSMKPVLYYRFFGILIIALICIIIIIFFFIFEKEKALNDSNMQLLYMLKEQRFIFDHAKDFVYRHDTKGIFIYVSKAVERILGYTQEEFQNHYTTYLTENPLNKKAAEYTENALRTGESSSSYELEIYHKNGSRIILEVSEEVYFEKGQIAGIIGIARDVTEKKKAQDMIANSAREWALTFDSMADGVSIHDPDFEIINVNRTLCDLLGKKKEELIGQKCYQIFHREDQPVSACPLEKSKYTKQREYVKIFEKTLNKWLAISVSPILDKNGDIVNIIHLIRDITERKRLEKTKDEFVSTVSHELRTPLTAIKEGIAIVLEGLAGPVNEEQKDFLDTAKKNVDRLSRLINDVLDYQKLQAGRIEFEMKPGDINAVMRDAKQIMEPLVKNKGLVLNLNLAGDLPVVSFDRDKIMQVVINLVNNAIKFTQKGSITVATSKKYDNAICVSVIDTGAGIKEEDLDKLFQSFSQVGDGKKNMAGGTGLGLAISKVIIQNHGGKIWVESEYGKGSAFYFVFPVVERRRPNYGS